MGNLTHAYVFGSEKAIEPELLKKSFGEENFQIHVANVDNVDKFNLSQAMDAESESIEDAKAVVDRALQICKENPGILASPEFVEALKVIYQDQELKFEYRALIKRHKPSGVLLSDIDDLATPPSNESGGNDSAAAELIALALEKGELFFDTQADKGFVSVNMGGVTHTLAIVSKPFVEWLSFSYYSSTKTENSNGKSASEAAIKQASFALSGIAKHEGKRECVYLRVADSNEEHYIFIGDEQLRVIEVTATGWRILEQSPVKFWKPSSMQSLPIPQTGGDLSRLWEFVNIPDTERPLLLAWMLESFRAETPKPIMALSGTQGCAKSSTQNKIRQLIDNNSVNLRAAPKSVEDVFVSAGCNWLASFENLSHITPNMQDALCTLATGGGFAARTLYTNTEETIIEVKRPVIVNSIPNVITAQDLTDRAISIELPPISYREETEISKDWEAAKPAIFGGLLDLFADTLKVLPSVKLDKPPRMADFTRLGEAMMQSQGNSPGVFDTLYKANRSESIGRALESSPVAVAVCEMVDKYTGCSAIVFNDTVKKLLEELSRHRCDSENWPRSPKGLSDALKRQSPALSALGIEITHGKKAERTATGGRGLTVKISKSVNVVNIGNMDLKELRPEIKIHNNSAAFESADKVEF